MVTEAVKGHVVKWPAGLHPVDQAGTWFKMPLYQWQIDVLNAAAEPYSRVVVSTNNESGKTSCVGPIFILSAMMAFPGARCFATSGSEEQIRAQFFETNLLPIIRPLQAYGWKVWTGDSGRVLAPNGSTLLCYVCKDANKAEGFHAGWNSATGLYEPCVYLSDESKEVKDGIHEAIRRINPTFFLGMSSPGENNWFSRGINQEQLKVIVEQRGGEDTPQRLRYKALAEKILED